TRLRRCGEDAYLRYCGEDAYLRYCGVASGVPLAGVEHRQVFRGWILLREANHCWIERFLRKND
ncbi:MAG: hypothetical protein R6V12_02490, partial [Candidatus Hydrogenedentota bacterium]